MLLLKYYFNKLNDCNNKEKKDILNKINSILLDEKFNDQQPVNS